MYISKDIKEYTRTYIYFEKKTIAVCFKSLFADKHEIFPVIPHSSVAGKELN